MSFMFMKLSDLHSLFKIIINDFILTKSLIKYYEMSYLRL